VRLEQTETFSEWLDGLRDVQGKARILVRVDRLAHGNPGQQRTLKGGVKELKLDFGPGYRVYYTMRDDGTLVVLLAGGDKSTQARDIETAVALAANLKGTKK
jgi:putative addiction module killer protein